MKFRLIQTVLALAILMSSCGGDDAGSPPVSSGDDEEPAITASYTATLSTNFSEENFPTDYPNNATFGPIIVFVHSPDVSIYSIGQVASEGMKAYVETGDADALTNFITNELGEQNEGQFTVQTEGSIAAVASEVINLTFTPERTRVTIIANLNPSTDWFTGVSSFDITDGDTLIENESVGLSPLDGGTLTGDTYESDGMPDNAVISVISGLPFSDGNISEALGNIEFSRIN